MYWIAGISAVAGVFLGIQIRNAFAGGMEIPTGPNNPFSLLALILYAAMYAVSFLLLGGTYNFVHRILYGAEKKKNRIKNRSSR
jgi:hypothetical protein